MRDIVLPEEYHYTAAFLTMRCNLNCSFCLNAFDKRFDRKKFKEVSGEEWVEGLNRIKTRPEVPVTFCGGEPFMHKDFFYIIKNLKPELRIDMLTNLHWGERGIEKFISEVNPRRLKRDSPYASIRVSYHPEQMGSGEKLVENAKKLQDAGFRIAIYYVAHPDPKIQSDLTEMQFFCKNKDIEYLRKDFTGLWDGIDRFGRLFSISYGNYSKYLNSCFQENAKRAECKTSELLIAPDMRVYRCHRDLFAEENSIRSLLDDDFRIENEFGNCDKYGQCHPCDVKIKTNYKQQLGNTSVEIKDII